MTHLKALTVVVLCLAVVSAGCEASRLDLIREEVRERNYVLTVIDKRDACNILRQVDYDYDSLSEKYADRMLRAAAAYTEFSKDYLQWNCERYWSYPLDPITRHFTDHIQWKPVVMTCWEWTRIEPRPSFEIFRAALRHEHVDRWPEGERQRFRQLGIHYALANDIWFAFDRSESSITAFCEVVNKIG